MSDARRAAALVLVETSGEYVDERRHGYAADVVLADPAHALYLFRRARSRTHPLWTGQGPDPADPYRTGGDAWERVQVAARVLELPETEPVRPTICECRDPFHRDDGCKREPADHGPVIASPALCLPCLHGCDEFAGPGTGP